MIFRVLAGLIRAFVTPLGWIFSGILWFARSARNRRHLAIGVGITLVAGIVTADLALDHRHLPWRGLDIDDRAGLASGMKLRAIELGPNSWCHNLVDGSESLEVRLLERHDGAGSCGWSQAFHIEKSGNRALTGTPPYAMRCALAAGAHIWLNSVDHHARNILGSKLARVHHVGTYSCRRMYNRSSGKMSQHAFANAWDVTGFELADGRVISVLKHWDARGSKQRFLRAVHRDACRTFNVVLGPEYNAAHRDHFHVDMGHGGACR